MFFNISANRIKDAFQASKSFPNCSKMAPKYSQEAPKRLPRGSQDLSKRLQERSKRLQDAPSSLQDHPNDCLGAFQSSHMIPKRLQEASKSLPRGSKSLPRGSKSLPRGFQRSLKRSTKHPRDSQMAFKKEFLVSPTSFLNLCDIISGFCFLRFSRLL